MYSNIPRVNLVEYNLVSESPLFSRIGGWYYSRMSRWPGRIRLLLQMFLQNLSIKYKAHHEETINLNTKGVVCSWPAICSFLPGGLISTELMETHWAVLNALGLKQDAVIFDIGANIGSHSMVYGLWTANDDGKVYSFEPFPENYSYLKKNTTNCGLSNVVCHDFGLSDSPGSFFLGMPSTGQHRRFRWSKYLIESGTFSVHAKKPTSVETSNLRRGAQCHFDTMDRFVKDHPVQHVDFIKIDTEGHELFVLKGGKEALRQFRPIIQLEMNAFALDMAETDPKEIIHWLTDLDYLLYTLSENTLQPFHEEQLTNGKFGQGSHIAFLFELYAIPK
jgi:FkbM family methyltransferase